MENNKKSDLRLRKRALKSKLMSALALLLVASIMMGTSTYAWFVLSTAPEVKGMSTTVGSNGSLEIALRDWDTEHDVAYTISSGVGDSYSVTANWKQTNHTWGNIVDLSSPDYGLNGSTTGITLYPARLNLTVTDGVAMVNTVSPLLAPQYGTDGRVANLSKTLSTGRYTADGYMADQTGVRGIGEYAVSSGTEQTITRAKLADTAHTRMNSGISQATTSIGGAVNTVLPYVATLGSSDEDYIAGGTGDKIVTFLQTFETQVNNLQAAVGYAYLMEKLNDGTFTASTDTPGVILNTYAAMTAADIRDATSSGNVHDAAASLASIITAANTAATNAAAAKVTTEGDPNYGMYSVTALKAAVNAVLAYNNLYTDDGAGNIVKLGTLSGASAKMTALTNAVAVYFYGDAGHFAEVAAITGKYSFHITMANADAYVTSVAYNSAVEFEDVVNDGYLAAVPVTDNTTVASTYTTNASNGATYGFAIDLAFRSNAATGLALTPVPLARVDGDGDQSDELMGTGSTVSITGSDTDLLSSIVVAFIDPADGKLLGIAKATNTGALTMCTYTINATTGALELTPTENQTIIAELTENEQNNVTVVVFLDGDTYDKDGGDGTVVTVNLQFASTTVLVPMDYTGYLTTAGETTGTGTTPEANLTVAVDGTTTLTADEAPEGATITWTSSNDDTATVSDAGVVTGVAAGTVTITASWEAGGEGEGAWEAGSQTFTVTVTT